MEDSFLQRLIDYSGSPPGEWNLRLQLLEDTLIKDAEPLLLGDGIDSVDRGRPQDEVDRFVDDLDKVGQILYDNYYEKPSEERLTIRAMRTMLAILKSTLGRHKLRVEKAMRKILWKYR